MIYSDCFSLSPIRGAYQGDSETVRKHLSVLGDGPEAALYRAASEVLVSIAERKNPDRDYAGLRRILE